MISVLKESDIHGLDSLPPREWNFSYEVFIKIFIAEEYFSAFVMAENGNIIGTGNVFLKDKVGWLANIIVDGDYRGRGLGFQMTKFLVEYLDSKGCESQLLLATELGERVYHKIGFRKISEYVCYDSVMDQEYIMPKSIRKLGQSDLVNIYELDRITNGENRKHLIDKFYHNGLGYFSSGNNLLGFYLPEFGRGLVLSEDIDVGLELLRLKHSKQGRRTMLPIENTLAVDFLEKSGFKKGTSCSKMIYGKDNSWNPNNIYSYAGGYCG